MKPATSPATSGKTTAILVSMVGLILVWGIVWANLPSKHELLSAQSEERTAAAPSVPELDLRIPGVPAASSSDGRHKPNSMGAPRSEAGEGWTGSDFRAREIAEVKCEAEVQQACPESLDGEGRRRCVAQRMNQFPPFCRQMVRQRMVRWKEAEGYKAACADDVKRVCPGVEPGDGRILQCLQEQAQGTSEACYQSLPKGQLLLRR
jgi:hypothetical protein